MPAIYSQDPNAGIRQLLGARAEQFIPRSLNSMTFKGNSKVNEERKKSYANVSSFTPSKVLQGAKQGYSEKPTREDVEDYRLNKDFNRTLMAKDGSGKPATPPGGGVRVIPASVQADNMINEYLNAQNQAMKVAINPDRRPVSWNGYDPDYWLSKQPRPSVVPGMSSNSAAKVNWWNKTGATDLPSSRYGVAIA